MAERRQHITDEGSLHRYRTEIPNTIIRGVLGRKLSLPARWLYVYLKSVAGDDGECWQNMTTLTAGSQLSRGAVSKARKELHDARLIEIIKGKGALHETDRVRIFDIWHQNMTEFCSGASSPYERGASSPYEREYVSKGVITAPDELARVHHMNAPSSPHERASSPHERLLKKIPEKKEENSLTTFESLEGTVPAVPSKAYRDMPVSPMDGKPSQSKKTVKTLSEKGWLYPLLQEYKERFDVDALNDEDWWKDLANSLPASTFTEQFMRLALADLAGWLRNNPRQTPRSPIGWRKRMNYSLNYYYDKKHIKRANTPADAAMERRVIT